RYGCALRRGRGCGRGRRGAGFADGAGAAHAGAAVEVPTAALVPVWDTGDAHPGRRVALGHVAGAAGAPAAVVAADLVRAIRRAAALVGDATPAAGVESRAGVAAVEREARAVPVGDRPAVHPRPAGRGGTAGPEEWLRLPRRRSGLHAVAAATTDVRLTPLAVGLAPVSSGLAWRHGQRAKQRTSKHGAGHARVPPRL